MSTMCLRASVDVHFAVIDGLEFDVGRVGDGVPDDISVTVVFEPAPIGVVPAQIRVDG